MRPKQTLGLVFFSIGMVFLLYSLHGMGYITAKQPELKVITDSPVSPTERVPESSEIIDAGSHKKSGMFLIGGVVLVVMGAWMAFYYREHGA